MSIEEMKAAVLAECQRLCSVKGRIVRIDPEYSQHYIRMDDDGDYCLRMDGVKCYVGPSVEDESLNWLAAYRLLGLEAKAKDADISRLQSEISILQGERKIAEYFSLPKTIEDLEPFLLTLLSSHSIRVSEGVRAIRNAFDELTSVKDAEIQRLRAALEDIVTVIEGMEEHPDYDLSDQEAIYAKNVASKALKGGTND